MTDFYKNFVQFPGPCIFFVGQAGFIFKTSQGTTLGLDLYLSDCVEFLEGNVGYKRLIPHIVDSSEIKLDYLVATHPHYDHFDVDAMPSLMSDGHTKLFASVNCQKEVIRLKMCESNISYVKPGISFNAPGLNVEFVPCDHGSGAPDAFGCIVSFDNYRIYIAGDTSLHTELVPSLGRIDICIAPINGAYGNLNETECMQLCKALAPGVTVPCHFGMFASHGGNPGLFKKLMDENKLPFYFMTPGETARIKDLL